MATRFSRAAYEGVWLGILGPDDLQHLAAEYYQRERAKYDFDINPYMTEEWNFGGFKPWEEAAVDAHFARGSSVLIAGAGAGREAFALAERGCSVVGFDSTPEMIERARYFARERGIDARFVVAKPDEVPVLGRFDGAILGWGLYGHLVGKRTRVAFLKAVAEQVHEGGPILVSAQHHHAIGGSDILTARIANALRRPRRLPLVETGDEIGDYFYHRFTREELVSEVEGAGFPVVRCDDKMYLHAVALRT